MRRRDLLKTALAASFSGLHSLSGRSAVRADGKPMSSRVRPGEPGWPADGTWQRLNTAVDGQLLKPQSPFANCARSPSSAGCTAALKEARNPYFLADNPALTQSSGWVDAWTSQPSRYAVAARSTAHIVAAVNFAREHRLRLVLKGCGHSYLGTSNAADSLLIWTHQLNDVTLQEAFVPRGCAGKLAPQPDVTVGAGAMWRDAYTAVTTQAGRYVQGGGCQTVGVAGLVQGGGFGSWSKRYGTAAAGLLEAEVVTADGAVRIANACMHPDLFWALKGGGGGTFGVVRRFTLRTRALPEFFGVVSTAIRSGSDAAYRALIAEALQFYRTSLMNPNWGEKMIFARDFGVSMLFQGLTQQHAQSTWAPFLAWVRARSEYTFVQEPRVIAIPAQHFWDPAFMMKNVPGAVLLDDRPEALPGRAYWAENRGEAGTLWHGYKTAWLPAALLEPARLPALAEAIFAATRHWGVGFHFNKALAGAPAEEIAAARDTATNPAVLDAFTCAFIASGGPPAFAGMPGGSPDLSEPRAQAQRIGAAMDELLKIAPGAGSYLNESDYFLADWQRAYWGENYPRLAAIKQKYDPQGLFFVHHGVGSEHWSADGFTRL